MNYLALLRIQNHFRQCNEGKPHKFSIFEMRMRAVFLRILPTLGLCKYCFSMDILLFQKISKCHFFPDNLNSSQQVTQMGLEPHQNFSFEKISKNKAARPILSILLFWQEFHFQCNYILNIFREVEFHIDLQLVKFWW